MQLYCKSTAAGLIVIAVHADGDVTPAAAYGDDIVILPYAGGEAVADLLAKPAPAFDLVAYAKAKRWAAEVGGVTHDGARFATDDRSKLLLNGAAAAAARDPAFATPWFTADGTVKVLDAAGVAALSEAVVEHVNDTFKVLANVAAGLAAEPPTITTLAAIDEAFAALHD